MPIYSQNKQIVKIMNNNNDVLFNAIKNINEKSMTGAPSLQFQSNGDNLTNYTIYGNKNGVGDYNLTTQKYDIPITVSNKNLFDMSKVDLVNLNPQFGTGKVIQFDSSVYSLVMPLEEGLYTFSILAPLNDNLRNRQRIACYSRYPQLNDETLSWTEISHRENDVGDILSVRFSAPHGTKYIMIFLWYKDYPLETITSILESIQIMIQPGDVVTNYIAHNSNTTNIQLDAPLSFNDKKEIKNHNLQTYSGLNIFSVNTEKKPVAITLNNDNFTYINSGLQKFYIVRYYNEDELVYTEYVPADKNAMGLAEEASPKKTSSEQYDYIFKGWSAIANQSIVNANILNNITNNKDVYAVFEQVERTFTVQFYGEDINTPIQTVQNVPYGGTATYTGATPTSSQAGYIFSGWSPSNTNITADTSCYAQFVDEDMYESISDTWSEIIANVSNGTYSTKYHIGDTKKIDLGTEGEVIMQIVGIDADNLADNSGKAPITWISKQLLNTNHRMNPAKQSGTSGTGALGGWEACEMSSYLINTIKPLLPSEVRNALKTVKKYSKIYNTSGTAVNNVVSNDDIWIPSAHEVNFTGHETSGVTYSSAFPDNASRIKHKVGGSAAWWWLRSADVSTSFRVVNDGGSSSYHTAGNSGGVAVGFCT